MNAITAVSPDVDNTLVLVLAGGQGSRLKGLTEHRSKPVLEFGGSHRIIDFTLSNCVNSGFKHIAILTQYKSQCLIRHLMTNWGFINHSLGGSLDILPASPDNKSQWYSGTADACYQNLEFIQQVAPKYVMVLSGDHVYQMDYRDLLDTHVRQHATMTLSCIEVPLSQAQGELGVMNVNATGRITDFDEKPERPQSLSDTPGYCLASMGNYVFDTQSLVACLAEDAEKDISSYDFGKDVIPKMILCSKVVAHRFRDSQDDQIPYWRDVGTLDSYWQSHMELLAHPGWLPLDNPNWPMWGQDPVHNTSTLVTGTDHQACEISKSRLHTNCQLSGCTIFQSALSKGCKINPGANIDSCVLLPEVVIESGVQMSRVIVDKGCVIPKNMDLTDPDRAFRQGFTVTNKGVILVTQSMINESQRKTFPIHPDLHSLEPISIPLDDVYLSKRQIFFK